VFFVPFLGCLAVAGSRLEDLCAPFSRAAAGPRGWDLWLGSFKKEKKEQKNRRIEERQ